MSVEQWVVIEARTEDNPEPAHVWRENKPDGCMGPVLRLGGEEWNAADYVVGSVLYATRTIHVEVLPPGVRPKRRRR